MNEEHEYKLVWEGGTTYDTIKGAIEGYTIFVLLIQQGESCNEVCEEGTKRVHVVETLAESVRRYASEEQAWGEAIFKDPGPDCHFEGIDGVRRFTKAVEYPNAFILTRSTDDKEIKCNEETEESPEKSSPRGLNALEKDPSDITYSFKVTTHLYRVATHTCSYADSGIRNDVMCNMPDRSCITNMPTVSTEGTLSVTFTDENSEEYSLVSFVETDPGLSQSERNRVVLQWLYFSIRGASFKLESPLKDKWVLYDTLQDIPLAYLHKGDQPTNIPEHRDAIVSLARIYPVYIRDEQYAFRLLDPANDDLLDEELEIQGCASQIDNVNPPSQCIQPYLFESVLTYESRELAQQAYLHFCSLLRSLDNFAPTSDTEIGPFSFEIVDPCEIVAIHPYKHPDKTSATRAMKRAMDCAEDEGIHLVEHILLRPTSDTDCTLSIQPDISCLLSMEGDLDLDNDGFVHAKKEQTEGEDSDSIDDINPVYIPGSDPYSFWATVVLPSWVKRFRTEEGRQLFREMLYREVPAMVGLNIAWLGPMAMHKFDISYKAWLDSERDISLCETLLVSPKCDLINCIRELSNDPLTEEKTHNRTVETLCGEPPIEPVDNCISNVDYIFWSTSTGPLLPVPEKQFGTQKASQPDSFYLEKESGAGEEDDFIQQPIEEAPKQKPETSPSEEAPKQKSETSPSEDTEVLSKEKPAYSVENDQPQTLPNLAAIRGAISDRIESCKDRFGLIQVEENLKTDDYKRVQHFLDTPSLNGYTVLLDRILNYNLGRRNSKKFKTFSDILNCVTWRLLDDLTTKNPQSVPPEAESALTKSFMAMKNKKIDLERIADDWNGKKLGNLLGSSVFERYIELLKEV